MARLISTSPFLLSSKNRFALQNSTLVLNHPRASLGDTGFGISKYARHHCEPQVSKPYAPFLVTMMLMQHLSFSIERHIYSELNITSLRW